MIPNLTRGTAAQAEKEKEKEKEQPDEAKPVTEVKKGTVSCPNCGTYFDPTIPTSILPINPPKEIQDILLDNLLSARAAAKSSKKRKTAPVSTTTTTIDGIEPEFKVPAKISKTASKETKEKRTSTTTNSAGPGQKTVAQKLADQESKRLKAQEGMSDAVKSMFKSQDGDKRGSGGVADFFGRTYTRVSPSQPFTTRSS